MTHPAPGLRPHQPERSEDAATTQSPPSSQPADQLDPDWTKPPRADLLELAELEDTTRSVQPTIRIHGSSCTPEEHRPHQAPLEATPAAAASSTPSWTESSATRRRRLALAELDDTNQDLSNPAAGSASPDQAGTTTCASAATGRPPSKPCAA